MLSIQIRSLAAIALALFGIVSGQAASAQGTERPWTVGVAGGLAVQPNNQAGHLSQRGWHAAANLTYWKSARYGFRLEGLTSRFPTSINHEHLPCPPDAGPFGCHSPVGKVNVNALTLGGIVRRGPTYFSLGGGVYSLADHPTEEGRDQAGMFAAIGKTFARRFQLEVQLHWVPGVELGGAWQAPVRLGVVW
jgi:hypothetical protein